MVERMFLEKEKFELRFKGLETLGDIGKRKLLEEYKQSC